MIFRNIIFDDISKDQVREILATATASRWQFQVIQSICSFLAILQQIERTIVLKGLMPHRCSVYGCC